MHMSTIASAEVTQLTDETFQLVLPAFTMLDGV
jgi:hypothetical protein